MPPRPKTPTQVIECLLREGWHPAVVFFEGSRTCRRLEAGLIRESVDELRKRPSLPRDVGALVETVELRERDDEVEGRWQGSIDGLRTLYHASPKGSARERKLLLDVARDRRLVAAMRAAVTATGEIEPTWMAVLIAEGSPESQAVVDRFRDAYAARYPELLRQLETFRGATAAPAAEAPDMAPPDANRPMDVERFWQLIDRASDAADPAEPLRSLLEAEAPKAIAAFDRHFCTMLRKAYRYDLWGAAYLMAGGCSDDGFLDFRAALIARGRAVFEGVLADPDSLADHPDIEGDETLLSVASDVYLEKTGEELPGVGAERAHPAGKRWSFDDDHEMRARYPRLYARAKCD
jgi:hypothetical protein